METEKSKWIVLLSVSSGAFLASLDTSIVNIALPTLVKDLNADFSTIQWVVLSYFLVLTTLILPLGRLGDILGKKRIYLTGFVIFIVGSILCGTADTVAGLIGFRVVQALGGSMVMALGMAIITEAFPPTERGTALGLIASAVAVAIAAGPTVGGILIDQFSWHWIFFVNVPIGLIGTSLVYYSVPDVTIKNKETFDVAAGILQFFGILSLLLSMTLAQRLGLSNGYVLSLFAGFIVFMILFIRHEIRFAYPIIDISMFRNYLFSINLFTGMIAFIAYSGIVMLLPFYIETIQGYNVRQTGYFMTIIPIMLGLLSPLSGSLSDKFGARPIVTVGLFFLLVAYYFAASLSADTSISGIVFRLILLGSGMGFFMSPNNSAVMGSVHRERLGIASGILTISRTLGQTLGIAILGSFWMWNTRYYVSLNDRSVAETLIKVQALQNTFHFVSVMILCTFVLSIAGYFVKNRQHLHP